MLIGEVSSKTGLSRDTIRFYEKKGLIQLGRKDRRANGYKEYTVDVLKRLESIKLMKGLGFTLNEISDLLDLADANEATCANVVNMATGKVELIDQKIRELEQIKILLIEGLSQCTGSPCNPDFPETNCPVIIVNKL